MNMENFNELIQSHKPVLIDFYALMDYDIQKGSGHLIKSTGTVTIKSIAEALGISFSTVSGVK